MKKCKLLMGNQLYIRLHGSNPYKETKYKGYPKGGIKLEHGTLRLDRSNTIANEKEIVFPENKSIKEKSLSYYSIHGNNTDNTECYAFGSVDPNMDQKFVINQGESPRFYIGGIRIG